MLILLLPLTTILVALVGFYIWHRQLVRKRHFEVADAALSAFCQADAAIARAREPAVGAGEGATRKRGDYELPAYGGLLDRLYIPVASKASPQCLRGIGACCRQRRGSFRQ